MDLITFFAFYLGNFNLIVKFTEDLSASVLNDGSMHLIAKRTIVRKSSNKLDYFLQFIKWSSTNDVRD